MLLELELFLLRVLGFITGHFQTVFTSIHCQQARKVAVDCMLLYLHGYFRHGARKLVTRRHVPAANYTNKMRLFRGSRIPFQLF